MKRLFLHSHSTKERHEVTKQRRAMGKNERSRSERREENKRKYRRQAKHKNKTQKAASDGGDLHASCLMSHGSLSLPLPFTPHTIQKPSPASAHIWSSLCYCAWSSLGLGLGATLRRTTYPHNPCKRPKATRQLRWRRRRRRRQRQRRRNGQRQQEQQKP